MNRCRELKLEENSGALTLKKLCTTRWTSGIDAVRAVRDRYVDLLKILTRISLTSDKRNERDAASHLQRKLDSYEFLVFIVFWERILRAFNSSSTELQSPRIDLPAACRLLSCTKNELQYLRDNWESVLETATAIANSWNVKVAFSSK